MRNVLYKITLLLLAFSLLLSGCVAAKVNHEETNSSYARQHKGEGARVTMIGSEAELMADVVNHFESPGMSGFFAVTREPHALFADAKNRLYAIYFYPSALSNQTDVEVIYAQIWHHNSKELKSHQADAFFQFFPRERIDKKVLKEGSNPILREGLANQLRWTAQGGYRKEALKYIDMGADIDLAISEHNKTAASLAQNILDPNAKKLYIGALTGIQLLQDLKKEPERREAEKRNEVTFQEALATYRSAATKPALPEEARKFKVQAEGAVQDKDFAKAALRYEQALSIAPWWPEGHFNRALVLGEIKEYAAAIIEMQRYLALVPEAPNARAAQDKIYGWEGKMQ